MTYALLNRLTAKPGKRADVVEHLLEAGRRFDDNPACLLYLVSEPSGSPDDIWVVDLWTTEEEHANALQDPEMRPHVEATIPLLERMPQQIETQLRGGKVPSGD